MFLYLRSGPTLTKSQVESSENRNKELTQRVRQQVTGLNRAVAELKNQVATLTAERDALKAQAPSTAPQDSPDLKALQDRITALQQEKSSLEASLNEVRAKATELSNQTATLVSESCSGSIPCLIGFQASVQKERDALLAEKEAWTKPSVPSTTEGTPSGSREEEKTQALRERDEALANCKVSRPQFFHDQSSIRRTESSGAGEPVEEPAEAKLHADRAQYSPYHFVTVR